MSPDRRRSAPIRLFFAPIVFAFCAATAAAQNAPVVGFTVDRLSIETQSGFSHEFSVELARTPDQMAMGLMFRASLAEDAGMMFDVDPVRPISMWMKNTLIPLDILFIDADGRIAAIVENTIPHSLLSIDPGMPVRGVLELAGGTAARLGIAKGDRVIYAWFGTAP